MSARTRYVLNDQKRIQERAEARVEAEVRATVLTVEQRSEAQKLRRARPPVLPGTNVILDDGQRSVWYDKVTETMKALGLTGRAIGAFCDVAGVPD